MYVFEIGQIHRKEFSQINFDLLIIICKDLNQFFEIKKMTYDGNLLL